jgi:hypothetical protein
MHHVVLGLLTALQTESLDPSAEMQDQTLAPVAPASERDTVAAPPVSSTFLS